jgi:hypothetical protein
LLPRQHLSRLLLAQSLRSSCGLFGSLALPGQLLLGSDLSQAATLGLGFLRLHVGAHLLG